MINLKELLLKQDDVEVVVEGVKFLLKRMTVADREVIKGKVAELQDKGMSEETATILATVSAMSLIDGKLAFEEFSLEELQQVPYSVMLELFVAISKANKMGASDKEESKENFTKTP